MTFGRPASNCGARIETSEVLGHGSPGGDAGRHGLTAGVFVFIPGRGGAMSRKSWLQGRRPSDFCPCRCRDKKVEPGHRFRMSGRVAVGVACVADEHDSMKPRVTVLEDDGILRYRALFETLVLVVRVGADPDKAARRAIVFVTHSVKTAVRQVFWLSPWSVIGWSVTVWSVGFLERRFWRRR